MPQPMTTTRACFGRVISPHEIGGPETRAAKRIGERPAEISWGPPLWSFRLVRRAGLLGQLVPLHAIAYLGAQPPFQWLGPLLDRGPHGVDAPFDQVAVHVKLVERGEELVDVQLDRAAQAPVGAGKPRDVGGV